MVHRHLHKRQNHHHGGDPFSSIVSSLSAAAASFFDGGDGAAPTAAASTTDGGSNPIVSGGPGPVVHSTSTSTSSDNGDDDGTSKGSNQGTSTKYVTATWTGTGTDFSLSTVSITQTPHPDPSPSQSLTSSLSTSTTDSVASVPVETTPIQTPSTTFHRTHRTSSSESSSLSAAATTSNSAINTAAAATTALSSVLSISSSATSASQAAATTSSAALGVSQNAGLSGGAKAGIAIGVILGVLALIAGAFALYRMKKNRDEAAFERENNSEKNPFSDTAAVSLGPVRAVSPPVQPSAPAGSSNPFGTGAVQMAPNPTSNGFNGGAMAAAGGLAGAAIGATAGNMTRANPPPPLNVNRAQSPALVPPPPVAPSPVGSNFSESSTLTAGGMSAVGGAGAGGPAGPRMHRVQMDFNPTMDDELRIVAGEIVRIVREFDDGWCSVEIVQRDGQGNIIRHQQGVVPRTCLSRLPLKPRQRRPGPPGAGPAPPMNNLTHPMGAQGPGRMQSPAFASNPTGRSMSPGPYGGGPQDRPQRADTRSRSNSANDINFRSRVAGPGPSRMNPASQNPRPIDLPIQSQSFSALPAPSFPGHNRNESAGSTASAPVARKPVPGQFNA